MNPFEDVVWGEKGIFHDQFVSSRPYCPSRYGEDYSPMDVREEGCGRGGGSHIFDPGERRGRGKKVVRRMWIEFRPDWLNRGAVSKGMKGHFGGGGGKVDGEIRCINNFSFVEKGVCGKTIVA